MVNYVESRPLLSMARHRHETAEAARMRAESSHGPSKRRRGLAVLIVVLIVTVIVFVGSPSVGTPRKGKDADDSLNYMSTSAPLDADRSTELEASGYRRPTGGVPGDQTRTPRRTSGTVCTVLVLQHGTIFFAGSFLDRHDEASSRTVDPSSSSTAVFMVHPYKY